MFLIFLVWPLFQRAKVGIKGVKEVLGLCECSMEEGHLLKQRENNWRRIPLSRPDIIGRKKETGLSPLGSSVPKRRDRATLTDLAFPPAVLEGLSGSIPQVLTTLPCPPSFPT